MRNMTFYIPVTLQNLVDLIESHFWILVGDFNLISSLAKKKGGICMLEPDSEAFNSFIQDLRSVGNDTINGLFT